MPMDEMWKHLDSSDWRLVAQSWLGQLHDSPEDSESKIRIVDRHADGFYRHSGTTMAVYSPPLLRPRLMTGMGTSLRGRWNTYWGITVPNSI